MKCIIILICITLLFTGCSRPTENLADVSVMYPQGLEIMEQKEISEWINTEKGTEYYDRIDMLVASGIGYSFDSASEIATWQLENYILRRVFSHYDPKEIMSKQTSPYDIEYFLNQEQYENIFKQEFDCDKLPIFPTTEKTLPFGSFTANSRKLRYPQDPITSIVNFTEDGNKTVVTAMITYPIETEKTMPHTSLLQYVRFTFMGGKIRACEVVV